ncbi:hypothetical protein METP2_03234 [Methanosarcinales archaeon]|nr:hypothetical protein [Candidatus Methanoperedens sp.]CAG1000651.1 hypothetical protein METP2_03234 [Methanosarcinales archaeon]
MEYSNVQEVQSWIRGFGRLRNKLIFHFYFPENMYYFKENIRMNKNTDAVVWHFKGTIGHGIRLGETPSNIPCINFFACDDNFNRALGKSHRGEYFESYQNFVVLDRKRLEKSDIDNKKEIVDVETNIPYPTISRKDFHKFDHWKGRGALLEFRHTQVVRLVLESRRKTEIPADCIMAIGAENFPKYFIEKVDVHNEENDRSISLFHF